MLSLLICCIALFAYIVVVERKNKRLSENLNELREKYEKLSGGDYSG